MREKAEQYIKYRYGFFCWCVHRARDLCSLGLQNSPWTVCDAIRTMVHKHFGAWSIYACCIADLLCNKSYY